MPWSGRDGLNVKAVLNDYSDAFSFNQNIVQRMSMAKTLGGYFGESILAGGAHVVGDLTAGNKYPAVSLLMNDDSGETWFFSTSTDTSIDFTAVSTTSGKLYAVIDLDDDHALAAVGSDTGVLFKAYDTGDSAPAHSLLLGAGSISTSAFTSWTPEAIFFTTGTSGTISTSDLVGTTNQITVSGGTDAIVGTSPVTLSLPSYVDITSLKVDSAFVSPTTPATLPEDGNIYVNLSNDNLYWYSNSAWHCSVTSGTVTPTEFTNLVGTANQITVSGGEGVLYGSVPATLSLPSLVSVQNLDANVSLTVPTTPCTLPTDGDVYANLADNRLYWYTNSSWRTASGSTSSTLGDWTLSGDTGTDQLIGAGDIANFCGSIAINTVADATDYLWISFDLDWDFVDGDEDYRLTGNWTWKDQICTWQGDANNYITNKYLIDDGYNPAYTWITRVTQGKFNIYNDNTDDADGGFLINQSLVAPYTTTIYSDVVHAYSQLQIKNSSSVAIMECDGTDGVAVMSGGLTAYSLRTAYDATTGPWFIMGDVTTSSPGTATAYISFAVHSTYAGTKTYYKIPLVPV